MKKNNYFQTTQLSRALHVAKASGNCTVQIGDYVLTTKNLKWESCD